MRSHGAAKRHARKRARHEVDRRRKKQGQRRMLDGLLRAAAKKRRLGRGELEL